MVQRCSNGAPFVVFAPSPTGRTGIQVRIFDGDDPNTLLDILPDTFAREWNDPLRGPGSGSFKVSELHPKLIADPDLLAYGNLVSFFLDDVRRFSIIIEGKGFDGSASPAEDGGRVIHVKGRGAKATLERGQVYPAGSIGGNPVRPFAASNGGQIPETLITEAQARGALGGVTLDFDAFTDSNNAPWAVPLNLDERAGTDLLRVVGRLEEVAGDYYMSPALQLQAFNERGIDQTIQTINTGPMILRAADTILEERHDEDGGIVNTLLIETATGFVERQDATSVAEHGRREGYISLGNVDNSDQVDRVAAAIFARLAQPADSAAFRVADIDGRRPYVDWNVGDYVLAPDSSGQLIKQRVWGLTVSESSEGIPLFEPEFNNITEELDARLDRWLASMSRGTLAGAAAAVTEPVATASLGEVSTAVADHELTNDHHPELHTIDSHDTSATGAQLDELTGAGSTSLHSHPGGFATESVYMPPATPDAEDDELNTGSGTLPAIWTPNGGWGGGAAEPLWVESGGKGLHSMQEGLPPTATAWAGVTKPMPGGATPPHTIEVPIRLAGGWEQFAQWGVIMTNAAAYGAGRQAIAMHNRDTGDIGAFGVWQWDSWNTRNVGNQQQDGPYAGDGAAIHFGEWLYLRLVWVSANTFRCLYSFDGATWRHAGGADASITLTPTHWGFGYTKWVSSANPIFATFGAFRHYPTAKAGGVDHIAR